MPYSKTNSPTTDDPELGSPATDSPKRTNQRRWLLLRDAILNASRPDRRGMAGSSPAAPEEFTTFKLITAEPVATPPGEDGVWMR